jgi:hypothetical protein
MTSSSAQPPRANIAGAAAETAAWRLLRESFEAVAGFARILLYDLSHEEAPGRVTRTGIALHGSSRWRAYLGRRRQLDDGDLSLVVSLRRLERAERLLAVDWGTAHANSFLLVEPLEVDVDLSSGTDPVSCELQDAAARGDRTHIERLLREVYGSWVYWPGAPATEDGCERMEIALREPAATLFQGLQRALRRVFPPSAFQERLAELMRFESELFAGRSIERARSPFLTRLGLPAMYEPSLVTGALRRMVNEGRIAAYVAGGRGAFQGPDEPVPDEVPDELFERMLL